MKLRALDATNLCVVEKLINDLLFEAEIGHLTPDHAYINMRDNLRQHQRSYVPAQQYQQQVHYQSSPIFNESYAPSFVYSGSPSPPCFPLQSGQHSQHRSQLLPPSHLNNSQQADKSSPISNKSYAPSFVSSGSPSPPCFPLQSGQHSQHRSQLLPPSHINNSQQADTYSIEMQTPTIQIYHDETAALPSNPGSTATFINNFNPDLV
jgi:hypothetical protein